MWVECKYIRQNNYLTDVFKKENELVIKRIELAKEMTEELQSKAMTKHNHEKYISDISDMNSRIDSLRNLSPNNLQGYEKKNSDDVLAIIVRCKYSVKVANKLAEESFDFYLSPDGSTCYAKKGI